MEPRSPGQGHAESEVTGADWGEDLYDRTSGRRDFLSGSDSAAEHPGTGTEDGTESQTTDAVALLQSLRAGVSARCAGSRLGGSPAQRRGTRRRWSEHRTDHRQARKRGGLSGGHPAELAGTDLSRPSCATSLYLQAQWETEAVGHSDGAGPGGAGSGVADTGANL